MLVLLPAPSPSYTSSRVAWYDSAKPLATDSSSLRCAIRLAVRARIGTPRSAAEREARTEQHRGDRGRHVEPQVLADRIGNDLLDRLGDLHVSLIDRRLLGHTRTARRRADRAPCAAGGRSPAPLGPRHASVSTTAAAASVSEPDLARLAVHLVEQAARRLRRAEDHDCRSRGCRPPPRPAAHRARRRASCARPGRWARGRARRSPPAWRRARRAARGFGSAPVSSSQKYRTERRVADQLAAQVARRAR